jgi:hypothetical protein
VLYVRPVTVTVQHNVVQLLTVLYVRPVTVTVAPGCFVIH